MSYEPTIWKSGDVVTSAKLNKMEQGIASGSGVVMPTYTTSDGETYTCDMTFAEITSAISEGKFVVARIINQNDDFTFLTVSNSKVDVIAYSTTVMDGKWLLCINVFHGTEDKIEFYSFYIPASSPEPEPDPEPDPELDPRTR